MRRLSRRYREDRGFALLLVFAMAAAVALLLYKELPRAVFESQRMKEDILVERGEQYKTGLRRYYNKFRRFPNTLDELESTNGQRFLRRRYKDPFTGKDEWKIIKYDAAGNLVDSVNSKKGLGDKDDKKGGTGSVSLGSSLGDAVNQPGENEGQDVTKKRASDKGIGADLAMQQYQQRDSADPGNPPGTTVQLPQQTGQFPGQVAPGQIPTAQFPTAQFPAGQQQFTGQQFPGVQPGQPGFSPGIAPIPGQQFPPGTLPPGLQLPGMVPQSSQQQGGSGMAQQGLGGGGSPMTQQGLGGGGTGSYGRAGFNPLQGVATPGTGVASSQSGPGAIMNQLTNPTAFRTQGLGGTPQNPSAAPTGQIGGLPPGGLPGGMGGAGMFGAGGIAGFASKHKGEGIKLIDERSKINEWEFIYDPRKDKRVTGGGAMGGGQFGGGLNGGPPTGTQTKPAGK